MATNYIPLDKEKHRALKVNVRHNFEFAKDTHLSAVTLREFAQVATCMPIALIKDPATGNHHVIAMLGIEDKQNLFMIDGKWSGHAVPLNIQRFPFDVRPDGDTLGVFIDENSDLISDNGESLFNDDGEPSDFLKNRQQLLGDIANSEIATQKFIKKLNELALLEEVNLMVHYADGKQRNVTGIITVSEARLNALSDEQTLDLKKSGFLGAIYAMLLSLGQMNRLVQLSAKTESPVRAIQLHFNNADKADNAEKQ
ncbi:SapC family protein [Aestuariibacter sp. AA17]|uniref:SapC family protein n=1 Tax=Fluctibacter corallii TaxID=2984329 RepID=A0ABT3A879_9ALTE|nr:SapC family protein [Aestuariibacter sp. AA17]MCV2884876.1 SapC family protein [Aestuariibacter sp. AA17]